jgi:hypothetical protein
VGILYVITPLEKNSAFVKQLGHSLGDNTYRSLMQKIMLMNSKIKCLILSFNLLTMMF